MLSLDPAKVLVVLVVALVVLGPDKLPRAARQLGATWSQLRRWRARLEEEVRGTFPDLPPAHTIGEAVRSPLRFLDRLADEHGVQPGEGAPGGGTAGDGAEPGGGPAVGSGPRRRSDDAGAPPTGVSPTDVTTPGVPFPGRRPVGDPSMN